MNSLFISDEKLQQLALLQNKIYEGLREGTLNIDHVVQGIKGVVESTYCAVPGCPHAIDCDVDPTSIFRNYICSEWEIVSHIKHGKIEFNPLQFVVQELDKSIADPEMRRLFGEECIGGAIKSVGERKFVNVCVLEYVMKNSIIVPDSWKIFDRIFFCGTVYRGRMHGSVSINLPFAQFRNGQVPRLGFAYENSRRDGTKDALIFFKE